MQKLDTPEKIKEFQRIEPYPDFETQYAKYFEMLDEHKIRSLKREFWEGYRSDDLLRQFDCDFDAYLKFLAKHYADFRVHAGTLLSWSTTRRLVYIRDGGICDICKEKLDWDEYECGHIVDRVCGGSNRLENLVVMCGLCNRKIKIMHETKEEYCAWKEIMSPIMQTVRMHIN